MSDSPLHVYFVEAGRRRYWYVASNFRDVVTTHRVETGEIGAFKIEQLTDDFLLTDRWINADTGMEEEFTQTCAEWAKGGEGYLFSA